MLPLFFAEQGASAPGGANGGVAIRRANTFTDGWTASAYIGGTLLGSFTYTDKMTAYYRALSVWASAWVNTFTPDSDPDN